MYVVASGRSVLSELKEFDKEFDEGTVTQYEVITSTDEENIIKFRTIGEAFKAAIKVNKALNCNSFQVFAVNE